MSEIEQAYETELREKIAELGGKAGGRSSIETLDKQLEELQKQKVECIKFTVAKDQRSVVKEEVFEDDNALVVIFPKKTPMRAKKLLYWFANVMYKWW